MADPVAQCPPLMYPPHRLAPPLPRYVAYYLRHLLASRFRLIPAEVAQPPKLKGRLITFTREQLQHVPESPQFQEALGRVGPGQLKGLLEAGPRGAPVLFLDGLGGWTLRLPKHGKSYQELRELRTPQALRPWRSYEEPAQHGRLLRRRHLIPLRYHPDAFLVIAVLVYPSGHVGYEAWVWHAGRKLQAPLYWDEARRCIDLFRDFAASWLWTDRAPSTRPRAERRWRHSVGGAPAGQAAPETSEARETREAPEAPDAPGAPDTPEALEVQEPAARDSTEA